MNKLTMSCESCESEMFIANVVTFVFILKPLVYTIPDNRFPFVVRTITDMTDRLSVFFFISYWT